MNPFTFSGMGAVSFGTDRIQQLADDIFTLSGSRSRVPVVLISDAGVAKAGILKQVESILEQAGHPLSIYCDLDGEPHAATVDRAAEVIRGRDHPCVVGLGGGSALDVAKLSAVIAEGALPAEAYALCARPFKKTGRVRIMIPTTAGTGTEVTRTATFTNQAGHKVWTWGQELVPDLVILDPGLTVSLPAQITAAAGLDALVHAIEACTCCQRNTLSDALGLHAIRLVSENLVTAIEAPEDLNARSGMLVASTLAGSAFAQTGTAGAHAIGHALSTIAGVPHGWSVAIAMDALLEWNEAAFPELHAAVAQALAGPGCADKASTTFSRLVDQTGLSRCLTDKAIDPDTLAELMMSPENLPMTENNARPISKGDALYLARRILGGTGRDS
jgi:alcohol dehydrogenase class IV